MRVIFYSRQHNSSRLLFSRHVRLGLRFLQVYTDFSHQQGESTSKAFLKPYELDPSLRADKFIFRPLHNSCFLKYDFISTNVCTFILNITLRMEIQCVEPSYSLHQFVDTNSQTLLLPYL